MKAGLELEREKNTKLTEELDSARRKLREFQAQLKAMEEQKVSCYFCHT